MFAIEPVKNAKSILALVFTATLLAMGSLTQAQGTKVLAESLSVNAALLPEFKRDPHDTEPQGNQISGVVRIVFQDKCGKLWFGTQNGIACYHASTLVYYRVKDEYGHFLTIEAIDEDKDGNMWFGHGSGITKYDGTYFTNFSETDGLVSNNVWTIAADRRGMVWIGTVNGVSRFDGKTFTAFLIPDGAPDPNAGVTSAKMVPSIIEDSQGRMWFGNNGGVHVYDGNNLTTYREQDGLCNNIVNSIIEDKAGNMWIATGYNGLCKFDGKTFTNITKGKLAGVEGAGDVMQDHNGHIWFTVKHHGIYKYDGTTFTNYHKPQGIDTGAVMYLMEDNQHRIWAPGFGGVYRSSGNAFVNVTRDGPW